MESTDGMLRVSDEPGSDCVECRVIGREGIWGSAAPGGLPVDGSTSVLGCSSMALAPLIVSMSVGGRVIMAMV